MPLGDRASAIEFDAAADRPAARAHSLLRATPDMVRARRTIACLLLAFACAEGFWAPETVVGVTAELETVELEETSEQVREAVAARRRIARRPDAHPRLLATAVAPASDVSSGIAPDASPLRTSWGRDLLHRDRRLVI